MMLPPYLMQQLLPFLPPQMQPQYSPEQLLAQRYGTMARNYYDPASSPWTHPAGGVGQPQGRMQDLPTPQYGQAMQDFLGRFSGQQQAPQMPAAQPQPSIGLSDIVRQMQGGLSPIAARQSLASLAGVPMRGPGIGSAQPQFQAPPATQQWSSQGMAPSPRPFSPLAHEGYLQGGR